MARPAAGPPSPRMLAAGERWARGYRLRHPPAQTEQDRMHDFEAAEAADERDRDRNR
jgi:hypothetical protein